MPANEFIELRERFDNLIVEINSWIKKKSIAESSKRLEKCKEILPNLRSLSKGDFQNGIVLDRTYQLEHLAKQIDEILSKREAGKREDGNIAFKCNWNDKCYKAPCSLEAYYFNIQHGRAWCSSPLNKCRDFGNVVSLKHHPCYESIALKEMYFGAGADHTGDRYQPRHIHSARSGRMALLTTRPPGTDEKERLVIGCLFIGSVLDDPGEETKIFGDKTKSIEIDYNEIKVKFWNYYKNAGAENLIVWASGLFRYVTDETVLNILKDIGEQYKNSSRDVRKIIELIRYYEELIAGKNKV
jgi:hypothetical protein